MPPAMGITLHKWLDLCLSRW